ncbi:hypothetical protein BDV30DRAFT_233700 [Aspergillus minisclerotigenes]|uniref:Uncharacterized protein n=1 Tax=Aspergillus minisclerotigenes TaxID=656917 RepID=A0A5N6JLT6_9EURO|nr:hypothetical protein BDV30DRAFT_233700 [Aspergillus minisclerotigenes]
MGRKSNRNRKGNVRQPNDVDVEVRVVLAYRFSTPATETDLTHEMKRKASSALREEPLQVTRDGGRVVVGNNEGIILTREMRRRDEELQQLKEQVERPYWFEKMVRQRFLLTYKRDKLHTASDEDCGMNRRVNKKARKGDALADAELYGDWRRRDYDVYKKLYGVHPKDIGKYYVSQGMDIMDETATYVAADDREGPPKFEELFQKYLRDLEAAEYLHDFLFEEACQYPAVARVRDSYWEFLFSRETEVRWHGHRKSDQDYQD